MRRENAAFSRRLSRDRRSSNSGVSVRLTCWISGGSRVFIRIVRRPVGEAPEWVRDAWFGLLLPTMRGSPRSWPVSGVLSGRANVFERIRDRIQGRTRRLTGYAVNAKAAVDLLATNQGISLHDAFEGAERKISLEETRQEITPSLPQAFVGRNMEALWLGNLPRTPTP